MQASKPPPFAGSQDKLSWRLVTMHVGMSWPRTSVPVSTQCDTHLLLICQALLQEPHAQANVARPLQVPPEQLRLALPAQAARVVSQAPLQWSTPRVDSLLGLIPGYQGYRVATSSRSTLSQVGDGGGSQSGANSMAFAYSRVGRDILGLRHHPSLSPRVGGSVIVENEIP